MGTPRIERPRPGNTFRPDGIQHFVRNVTTDIAQKVRRNKNKKTKEPREVKIVAVHKGDQAALETNDSVTRIK